MAYGVFIPQLWHYNLGPSFLSYSLHFGRPHQPVSIWSTQITPYYQRLLFSSPSALCVVANKCVSNC